MLEIKVKRHVSGKEFAELSQLLSAVTEADSHPALGEHAWLDLVQGGREGFAGLVALERGHDHPVGYAQLSRGDYLAAPPDEAPPDEAYGSLPPSGERHPGQARYTWALELVVDPHHRTPGSTVAGDLLRSAIDLIASEGGGHLHLWVNQPSPVHDRLAASVGLAPGRTLYQMRRRLPAAEHASITTRPFRVGEDEERWLEVNNRAFARHPEQGGWTTETLKSRQSQRWFDPDGFLLHDEGEQLAGFCWTKVHGRAQDRVGEIYVIAVSPEFAGRGLGRQLALAGLDYLSGKGINEAMLYVDATNARAVKMYVDLGFVVNHIDRAYTGDIPSS